MSLKKKLLFGVIAIFLLVYFTIFLSTNPLVKYVESVYRGEVDSELIKDTIYESFNISKDIPAIQKVDIKIRRGLVLHNFDSGYMLVKIDCRAYYPDDVTAYGVVTYEKWKIINTPSGWEIIEIKSKSKNKWGYFDALTA